VVAKDDTFVEGIMLHVEIEIIDGDMFGVSYHIITMGMSVKKSPHFYLWGSILQVSLSLI